jgi:hypothetical protein
LNTVVKIVFGPQTSDGPARIEFSVKPCSKRLRPGIRSLERSSKRAPSLGDSARSPRRVWTLRAFKIKDKTDKEKDKEQSVGVKYRAGCAQCKWAGCAVCRGAMGAHKGSKGRGVIGLRFGSLLGWGAHAGVQARASAWLEAGWKQGGAGWRQGFHWYERAGKHPARTQAVGLKEWWAGLH